MATRDVTLTRTTAKVLRVLLEDPSRPTYGFDIMKATGLKSGSLYPILARLEAAAWIVSSREDIDPAVAGRGARRYYVMTHQGAERARSELAALSAELAPPATRSLRPGLAQGGTL